MSARNPWEPGPPMEELHGALVTAVYISDDRERLVFETDRGMVEYGVEGDCCANAWFEDVESLAHLEGHRVTGSVAKPESDPSDDDEDDDDGQDDEGFNGWDCGIGSCRRTDCGAVLTDYGVTLASDAGHHDIVYRNSDHSSYGGYGGTLGHVGTYPADKCDLSRFTRVKP